MAGKLYVDEIRNTATTGSPLFPNGLDVTELIDPIGSEGDVLTVQADGTILAAAAGGAGIPITVSGITDRTDAAEIGAALLVALPPLQIPSVAGVYVIVDVTDEAGSNHDMLVADNSAWSLGGLGSMSGAGSVLVWGVRITD